jgi:hypothetical protein
MTPSNPTRAITERPLQGISLLASGLADGSDQMLPGRAYALVALSPPARLPLVATALADAVRQEQAASLVLATEPAAFVRRLQGAGFAEALSLWRAGAWQVLQIQEGFDKKHFRYGTDAFTRELHHYQVGRNSLLIFDQADEFLSLHDTALAVDQARQLSAWAERLNATVLLVFNRAASSPAALACLNSLMDELAGLARVGVQEHGLCLAVDYWQGPQGTVVSRRWPLEEDEGTGAYKAKSGMALSGPMAAPASSPPATPSAPAPALAPESHFLTTDGGLQARWAESLGGQWVTCNSALSLLREAMAVSEPTVLLPYARSTDLRQLAELVHTLKLALPGAAKLIVVECDAALRYGQEALLLRLGASLVIHRGAPEARIPLMLGAVRAQQAQAPASGIGFEAALSSVGVPAESGRVPIGIFVREARASVLRSSVLGVPNALLVGRPKAELTCKDILARLHLPRSGDLLSSDGSVCVVFLSSCPKASLDSALAHAFPAGLKDVFDSWDLGLTEADILARLGRLPLEASVPTDEAAEVRTAQVSPAAAHPSLPTRVTHLPEDFFSHPPAAPTLAPEPELESAEVWIPAESPDFASVALEVLPEVPPEVPTGPPLEASSALMAETRPLPCPETPEPRVSAAPHEALSRAEAVEASADSLHELFQRLSVHLDARASALSFADSAWPPPAAWAEAPPPPPPEASPRQG